MPVTLPGTVYYWAARWQADGSTETHHETYVYWAMIIVMTPSGNPVVTSRRDRA